ncbi:MAG: GAF domain-containing protein [Anaerolineae bacterium]|nr:GAF domain-containing protein [Anaerolineae bacterium]
MNQLVQITTLTDLRARFIGALAIASIAIGLAGLAPTHLVIGQSLGTETTIVLLLGGLWLLLLIRGYADLAALGLCASLTLASLTPPPMFLVIAVTALLAAAALLTRRGYLIVWTVIIVRLAFAALEFVTQTPNSLWELGSNYLIPLAVILITSLSARFLISNAERTASQSARAAHLLQFTAEIAHITSQSLGLTPLLGQVTLQIRERFGYYHVQVFLVDNTGDYAGLVASTGEVGQQLLMRKHRLAVGSNSVIGQATGRGEPVIARDSDPKNVRFRNELLPATRAELALPIKEGTQTIGVLDVQSRDDDAFDQNEVQSLQTLANVLASEIRNIRLYEKQVATAQDNERLYQQTQTDLEEIQRLNRELTGNAWRDYLREMGGVAGVTLDQKQQTGDLSWSEELRAAAQGDVIEDITPDHSKVAMPLKLHGKLIGAVEIETDHEIPQSKIQAMSEVLEYLATSLENARLYEASQIENVQKQRLNEIVTRYETVGSVEELLRVTLQELGETLGAESGTIRLGTAPAAETNGRGA